MKLAFVEYLKKIQNSVHEHDYKSVENGEMNFKNINNRCSKSVTSWVSKRYIRLTDKGKLSNSCDVND